MKQKLPRLYGITVWDLRPLLSCCWGYSLGLFSCLLMSVGTPSPSSPSMAWRSIPPFLRHASSLAGRTSVLPHISLHYGTLIYHDIPMPIGTHRYVMICDCSKICSYVRSLKSATTRFRRLIDSGQWGLGWITLLSKTLLNHGARTETRRKTLSASPCTLIRSFENHQVWFSWQVVHWHEWLEWFPKTKSNVSGRISLAPDQIHPRRKPYAAVKGMPSATLKSVRFARLKYVTRDRKH